MRSSFLCLWIIPLLCAPASGDRPPGEISSLSAEEAGRLADAVLPAVETIRGLKFKKRVPVEVVNDAAARAHFERRLETLVPAEQMQAEQAAYEQLGLLPEGMDLRGMLFDLLEEQAGGYYDPDTDTFYLLGDMPRGIVSILMAHELTHALDDQHFGIDEIIGDLLDNEDRADAFAAVVEGSGSVVMMLFVVQEMAAGRLDMGAMLEFQRSEAGRAEKLLEAPAILQRAMMAPYIVGQSFLLRGKPLQGMIAGIDTGDLDRAFRSPPRSFEQILHPEKYWDDDARDDPLPVELPDLAPILGEEWSVRSHGILGELDLAVLAGAGPVAPGPLQALEASAWTNDAAAGWGGDAWVLLSDGRRAVTVVGTLWDSVRDAEEFAGAVRLPPSARMGARGRAVALVAGEAGGRAGALAEAVLDALAP